jgi:carbon storage regulator
MLVITRKTDEGVVIDRNVTVTILEIREDKVRIGIEAPREIGVHRSEVWAQIQMKQRAADKAKETINHGTEPEGTGADCPTDNPGRD